MPVKKYMKWCINGLKRYLHFLATDADFFLMCFWGARVPIQSDLTDILVTRDLGAAFWNLIAVLKKYTSIQVPVLN